MLKFCVKYQLAVDAITADKAAKMRSYEMEEEEWKTIEDLLHVLKVSLPLLIFSIYYIMII